MFTYDQDGEDLQTFSLSVSLAHSYKVFRSTPSILSPKTLIYQLFCKALEN